MQQPADLLTLGDQYVGAACAFIANRSAAGTPWFLYYATHHVHSPQYAGAAAALPGSARGDFGESLAELDRNVGRLLDAVSAAGQADRTLVFLTSDNGPSLRNGARGGSAGLLKCGKGTTYEGGMRVPGIARWPGTIEPGRVTHAVASTLDLLPTLLDLATEEGGDHRRGAGGGGGGGSTASGASAVVRDGYSMRSILLGGGSGGGGGGVDDDDALADGPRAGRLVYYPQLTQRSRGAFAARAGAWKAHFATQGSLQSNGTQSADCGASHGYTPLETPLVFNLLLDPAEQLPLDPASAEYAEGLSAARAVLAEHEATLAWYPEPLLNAGAFNRSRQPCCKPGCKPFPQCCTCNAGGAGR